MRFLIVSLLLFIVFSCNNKPEKNRKVLPPKIEESPTKLPVKYEAIEIKINGKIQKFKFKDSNKDNVLAIKKLIESGKKLQYYKRELIDITGEGNLDTVEVRIDETGKNSFLITNSIFTHGKYAWRDTLDFSYDEDFLDMYFQNWGNDSTFYKLLPYSIYNEALYFKDFIDTVRLNVLGSENPHIFEMYITNYFKSKNLTEKYKSYEGHYTDLFRNNKSGIVTNLYYNDKNINVWFEPEQEFFEIWSP